LWRLVEAVHLSRQRYDYDAVAATGRVHQSFNLFLVGRLGRDALVNVVSGGTDTLNRPCVPSTGARRKPPPPLRRQYGFHRAIR
jgi:hypothetical protein